MCCDNGCDYLGICMWCDHMVCLQVHLTCDSCQYFAGMLIHFRFGKNLAHYAFFFVLFLGKIMPIKLVLKYRFALYPIGDHGPQDDRRHRELVFELREGRDDSKE